MFKLPFLDKLSPRKSKTVPNVSATPQIRKVAPSEKYHLGRHLAFTVGEDSVQMAASQHWGSRVNLLDVRKEYYASYAARGTDSPQADVSEALQQFISEQSEYLNVVNEKPKEDIPSADLQNIIAGYVKEFGGRHPSISVTLTGRETAHRTVTLPRLKGSELATALKFEAKKQIPFPIENCWVDYRTIAVATANDRQQIRASLVAATRVAVEHQLAPFRSLGIDVCHIYHAQDVIGQLLSDLPDFEGEKLYTLIDIHRHHTEISYYRGENLEFFHVSSLGSSFLANRTDPTVFEYFAESLATEIQNSLDYYSGQFSSSQTQEIMVYGDLSYSDELINLLSDRFGFQFRRFPSGDLPYLTANSAIYEDTLAVCLPAVAAVTNHKKLANLLPPDMKALQSKRAVDRMAIAAAALLVFGLAAQWMNSATEFRAEQNRLAELQRQAEQFQASEMFSTYSHLKRKLAANQAFLEKAKELPSYLGLNLKELSRLVPPAVRLYDLDYRSGDLEHNYLISGLIFTNDTPPEVILAELVENLSASPFYENVTIERHVKRRQAGAFVIDFNLAMKGII